MEYVFEKEKNQIHNLKQNSFLESKTNNNKNNNFVSFISFGCVVQSLAELEQVKISA